MVDLEEFKKKVAVLAQLLFNETGIDLVELNVRRSGQEIVIQILADRPTGGITMEECSRLNRRMVESIDQSGETEEYSLELSSPGVDRPLKTSKDFLRVINQEIHFYLNGPWQGKHEYTGVLLEITDTAVVVRTEKYGIIEIPIENILKAMIVL